MWGLASAQGSCPVSLPLVSASCRAGGWNPSLATHSPVSRSRGEACPLHTLHGGPLAPWSSRLPSPGPFILTPMPQPPKSSGVTGVRASWPLHPGTRFRHSWRPWPKMASRGSLGWWWVQVFHQPQYSGPPSKKSQEVKLSLPIERCQRKVLKAQALRRECPFLRSQLRVSEGTKQCQAITQV